MGKNIFNRSNLKKTYYYLKKNGWKDAYYAVKERISGGNADSYRYCAPEEEELAGQREESAASSKLFSILVPAYETSPVYLKEMIDSVLNQTYPGFELVIADASRSDMVEKVVKAYTDARIRYRRLLQNKGISENTNEALSMADGAYIGLLDHDDLLTPDALYQMAQAITKCEKQGMAAGFLYSDEDKGNGDCTLFYEPHLKPELDIDLLLSNNYICHFLVMERELMKKLKFRPAFDGAQDYDLILRAVWELREDKQPVVHIPEVLYHWRCHEGSTAQNPQSKSYAYEAGRRAVEDFIAKAGWQAKVTGSRHLGFYEVEYLPDIFSQRQEVGVIGGKLLDGNDKITGGIYDEGGQALYVGLHKEYSGYMHRAALSQEAYAVDVRCMRVRKSLWALFEEVFGVPYREREKDRFFDWQAVENEYRKKGEQEISGEQWQKCSLVFCRRVREAGCLVIWMPQNTEVIKKGKKDEGNGSNT